MGRHDGRHQRVRTELRQHKCRAGAEPGSVADILEAR